MRNLFSLIILFLCSQQLMAQTTTYSSIDEDSKKVSFFKRYNTAKLARELTSGLDDDTKKARAIFVWMAHNIKYDAKAYIKGNYKTHSPKRILKRRKGMCMDYSILFNALCRQAGIESVTISGYSKAGPYKPDDKMFRPDHCWNAVNINGQWKLLDVTFASGNLKSVPTFSQWFAKKFFRVPYATKKMVFRRNFRDEWFFREPEKMITDHLPYERMWQVLASPVPVEVFEQHESLIRNYLDSVDGDYPYSSNIENYRSSLNKELWEGDSAFIFNPRNVLQQAGSYHNAVYFKLRSLAKGEAIADDEYMDMSSRLQKLINLSDSAKKLFTLASESSREEFRLRNEKNAYRKKIATTDISAVKSFSTKVVEKFRSYDTKNKNYVDALESQYRSYVQKYVKLMNANLAKVKNNPGKESEAKSVIAANDVIIAGNRDTLNMLKEQNAGMATGTREVLEAMKMLNDTIFKNLGVIRQCTYYNCQLRANNFDNVDSLVIIFTLKRQEAIKDLDSLFIERNKILSSFKLTDSATKARIKQMQEVLKNNARLYGENKKISRDPEREEERYRADNLLVAEDIKLVIGRQRFVEEFLSYDRQCIRYIFKYTSKNAKLVKSESTIEESRYKNRQNMDKRRKAALDDDIKKGKKSCDALKAYAKAAQKKGIGKVKM